MLVWATETKASAPASALNSLRGHPSAPSAIIHALARKTLHRRRRYLGERPPDNDSSVGSSAAPIIRCDAQPPARASLAASEGDSSSPKASPPVSPVCQACACVHSLLLAFFFLLTSFVSSSVPPAEQLLEFMHQLPAFANMTMSVRRELCAVMVFAVVERAGTIVLNDGEEVCDGLYIVCMCMCVYVLQFSPPLYQWICLMFLFLLY